MYIVFVQCHYAVDTWCTSCSYSFVILPTCNVHRVRTVSLRCRHVTHTTFIHNVTHIVFVCCRHVTDIAFVHVTYVCSYNVVMLQTRDAHRVRTRHVLHRILTVWLRSRLTCGRLPTAALRGEGGRGGRSISARCLALGRGLGASPSASGHGVQGSASAELSRLAQFHVQID